MFNTKIPPLCPAPNAAASRCRIPSSPLNFSNRRCACSSFLTLGAGVSPRDGVDAAHPAGDYSFLLVDLTLRRGNPNRHRRPLMHLALDPEHPMMQLHDMLDDRESQSRPAQLARARAIDPIESLREPRYI